MCARKRTSNGRYPKKPRTEGFYDYKWSQVATGRRHNDSVGGTASKTNTDEYFGYKDSMIPDITLYDADEMREVIEITRPESLLDEIVELTSYQDANLHRYIQRLRNALMRAGLYMVCDQHLKERLFTEIDRMGDGIGDRGRKRWTYEEDEALIDMAARDDVNIIDLSREFGRTPSAIKTRISHLVGIERITTEVAGRFIGNLNGVFTEGTIDGTVTRLSAVV